MVVLVPVVYRWGVLPTHRTHTEDSMHNLDLIRRHFPQHARLIITLLLLAACAGLVLGGALLLS